MTFQDAVFFSQNFMNFHEFSQLVKVVSEKVQKGFIFIGTSGDKAVFNALMEC